MKVSSFEEAMSEEVVSECPAHGLIPPTKQNCPGSALGHESTAHTIPKAIRTIHAADVSEGPIRGCDSLTRSPGLDKTFDSTPESTRISPTQEPACDLLSFDAAAGFGSGCSPEAG